MSKNIPAIYSMSNIGYYANLATSLFTGLILHGPSGGIIAASATLTDETLIKHNYTSKHYLSTTALFSSMLFPGSQALVELFPEYSQYIYGASILSAAAISYTVEDPLNYHNQLPEVAGNLQPVVSLFDPEDKINENELRKISTAFQQDLWNGIKLVDEDFKYILSNKLLMTLTGSTMLSIVEVSLESEFLKYVSENGTYLISINFLANNPSFDIVEVASNSLIVCALWCGKIVITTGLTFAKHSLETNLSNIISEKVSNEILLNSINSKKILQLEDNQNLTNNLVNDFKNLFTIGTIQFNDLTVSKLQQIIILKRLSDIVPECIIIVALKGFINNKILEFAKSNREKLSTELSKLENNEWSIKADLGMNYNNIALIDALKFKRDQAQSIIGAKSKLSQTIKILEKTQEFLQELYELGDKLITLAYYGYKIKTNSLALEHMPLIGGYCTSVTSLFQGGRGITIKSSFLLITQDKIKKILTTIRSPKVTELHRTFDDSFYFNLLIIKDYSLNLGDKELLQIKNLYLQVGYIYALSGKSGIGKTSLLKDILECLPHPFTSKGEISLPAYCEYFAPPIIIDQNLYLPAKATLVEAITLQSMHNLEVSELQKYKAKIRKLLKFLNLDLKIPTGENQDPLDNPEFDISTLSGGEKKKIGIIRACMIKPKVLFLDEIFVGLDIPSMIKCQKLLKELLKECLIVVVDHQAKHNNYDGFYDYLINLEPTKYSVSSIHSIPIPEEELGLLGEI